MLKLLKGADSEEFGLKGSEGGGDLGFKDIQNTGSNQDTSVVDLRHLDPNKSITVDPNVVKGRERKIPVQVSEKTLNNENYIKGYQAILANDHAAAVRYFKKAQAELPANDILVKNAIALADALAKKQSLAYEEAKKGLREALDGEYDAAIGHLESARRRDPKNRTFRESLESVERMRKEIISLGSEYAKASPEKTLEAKALKLADQSLGAIYRHDYVTALIILEAAQSINPSDKNIKDYIEMVKGFRDKDMKSSQSQKKTSGKER